MTFDVDTLVEEILSKCISPRWIHPKDSSYYALEASDTYLRVGPVKHTQLFWMDNPNLKTPTPNLFIPNLFIPHLTLLIRSDLISVITNTPSLFTLEITSLQEWQKFLEQDLPEFIKKKEK